MLSQRIALYSKELVENNTEKNRKLLHDAVVTMEKDHKFLHIRELADELKQIYDKEQLHDKLFNYVKLAEKFIDTPNEADSKKLFTISQEILPLLDRVVKIYQDEVETQTEKLRTIETYILISALLTLLFEAIYIFKPSLDELRKSTEKDIVIEKQKKEIALSHLLRSISHSWRQTLNKIFLGQQLIEEMYEENEIDKEKIIETTEESKRYLKDLSTTIDNYIKLFTPGGESQEFNAKTLLKTAINDLTNRADIQIEGEDLILKSYPGYLINCINILFQNSIEASQKKNMQPKIAISISSNAITYQDNCGGIDEKDLDHIFDPYFTTKFQKSEEGMGLFFFKIIAENHLDTAVTVENTGKGVKFTLLFEHT